MKKILFILVLLVPFSAHATAAAVRCPLPLRTQGKVNYFLTSFANIKVTVGKYVPSDLVLVDTTLTKDGRNYCLRKNTYNAFLEMNTALKNDTDLSLIIRSGFRSYTTQQTVKEVHEDYAALPGRSEHQLGTAVDLIGSVPNEKFVDSKEYLWMREHAATYGFVESFQAQYSQKTGMVGEPWHWRYVGPEMAQLIKSSRKDSNAYLLYWYFKQRFFTR